MRVARHVFVVALACLSNICLSNFCLSSLAAAQQSDQVVAERVLGPQWKQLSRRAGMIFAGTVLTTGAQTLPTQTATTQPVTTQGAATDLVVPGTAPSVQLCFRVDRAIAGVETGQVLTVREWAGAWAIQRPMRKGQHILLFLYPPSRLGFTSPVGGSMGQVVLDPSGENEPASSGNVSVIQLERAIRTAREE